VSPLRELPSGYALLHDKQVVLDSHESIEMTLRYSHLSPDVKRDAVNLLDLPGRIPSGILTATQPVHVLAQAGDELE
jgi:hypothetical protein